MSETAINSANEEDVEYINDPELLALNYCEDLLLNLQEDARKRNLDHMNARFGWLPVEAAVPTVANGSNNGNTKPEPKAPSEKVQAVRDLLDAAFFIVREAEVHEDPNNTKQKTMFDRRVYDAARKLREAANRVNELLNKST